MYLYCLDQAEDLFGGVGQVLAGGFRGSWLLPGWLWCGGWGRRRQCRAIAEAGLAEARSRRKQGLFCCILAMAAIDTDGGFSHDGLASRRPSPVITMSAS